MIRFSTFQTSKKLNWKKHATSPLMLAILMLLTLSVNAQSVLVGLTSNGGINGKGTAFSINTNGSNFSLINGFIDWGNTPNGSFFKNDDGNFYGMTSKGGANNSGTIFMMTPAGQVTMLKQFFYTTDGAYPDGELIKGPDGYLYGLTSAGGTFSYGTIFKISTTGDFSVIKHFNSIADGANPHGHLVFAADSNFYGITYSGGSKSGGTIFKLTRAGIYSVIHNMDKATEGANSFASLTQGKDGYLYGTTYSGGQFNNGTIFKVKTDGTLSVVKHLSSATDGAYPQSDIIQAKDGSFYGTTYSGGLNGGGTIFKITNGNFSIVKNFSLSIDGGYPYSGLMQYNDTTFYGITRTSGPKSGGTIYKLTKAGAYSIVHALDYNTEGNSSSSVPVKGNDGSLYAMTSLGGTFNYGIIFKTTTAGDFKVMNTFNGAVIGNAPYSSFIKGKDSAYYCTTSAGGAYGFGSIVKICGGKTTVFYSFNKSTDGGYPKGNLVLASDGNFYGMTSAGGINATGTIFRITTLGKLTVMHNFISATEGTSPVGSLIQAKDGFLYGMTVAGGSNNGGTIFKMNLAGTSFSVLKNFVFATDGGAPTGNLVQAKDGNFYGMTSNGGRIFQLTQAGVYNNLHTFNSSTDGYNPTGSLIQGLDGNLYGTCSDGGAGSAGTIFKMALDGTGFKVLVALNTTAQGRMPKGTLLQGPDGMLYGTTSIGGTYNTGTIFKVSATGTNFSVLRHMNIIKDGGNAYGALIFAPVNNLVADAKTATVDEDSSVKITLSGSGGSPLAYAVVNKPTHGTLTGTVPNLTYKPNKNYNGTDNFTYTVGIGCMISSPATVTITVIPKPDTPVLAPIGNKTVIVDSTLKFKVKATDADSGQTIKYSLIGAPAGAKISSGTFTWTPTTPGSYTFKIRATDSGTPALYDEEQITVTVTNSLAAIALNNMSTDNALKATIFPNPAHDVLNINMPSVADKAFVRIINVNGRVAAEYELKNNGKSSFSINITKLSSGIYFAQIQTGELTETLKFIKN